MPLGSPICLSRSTCHRRHKCVRRATGSRATRTRTASRHQCAVLTSGISDGSLARHSAHDTIRTPGMNAARPRTRSMAQHDKCGLRPASPTAGAVATRVSHVRQHPCVHRRTTPHRTTARRLSGIFVTRRAAVVRHPHEVSTRYSPYAQRLPPATEIPSHSLVRSHSISPPLAHRPARFRHHLHDTRRVPPFRVAHRKRTAQRSAIPSSPCAQAAVSSSVSDPRSITPLTSLGRASNSQYASYNRKLSQTTGMSDCNLLTAGVLTGRGRKANGRQTKGNAMAIGNSRTTGSEAIFQAPQPTGACINQLGLGGIVTELFGPRNVQSLGRHAKRVQQEVLQLQVRHQVKERADHRFPIDVRADARILLGRLRGSFILQRQRLQICRARQTSRSRHSLSDSRKQ